MRIKNTNTSRRANVQIKSSAIWNQQSMAPHSSFLRKLMLALCCVFTLCASAAAQVSGGSITGTVTDPSGAVVRGATVRIVNRGTGITQTYTTSSAGLFTEPNIDPGNYDVICEAQ